MRLICAPGVRHMCALRFTTGAPSGRVELDSEEELALVGIFGRRDDTPVVRRVRSQAHHPTTTSNVVFFSLGYLSALARPQQAGRPAQVVCSPPAAHRERRLARQIFLFCRALPCMRQEAVSDRSCPVSTYMLGNVIHKSHWPPFKAT